MTQESINKHITLTIFVIILALFLFEFTNIDIWVSNHFYDFEKQQWLLTEQDKIIKFIFYDGIKRALIFLGVLILIVLLFFRKKTCIQAYKKGLLIVLLAGVFVPVFIGFLKAVTNTPCPHDWVLYNGTYPNLKLFDYYPIDFIQKSKIKCWPAGHASGGFVLMALFFLFKTQNNKNKALFLGLAIGWSMGIYKMIIGDHFFSHTVMTMLFAWLIILIIAKFVILLPPETCAQKF